MVTAPPAAVLVAPEDVPPARLYWALVDTRTSCHQDGALQAPTEPSVVAEGVVAVTTRPRSTPDTQAVAFGYRHVWAVVPDGS